MSGAHVDENAAMDASALDALREVEARISCQESCGSADAGHDGCYVADSLSIVREVLARFGPPPTPQPANLGTVVRDASGEIWVRIPYVGDTDYGWRAEWGVRGWDYLAQPIEVLSEGWVDDRTLPGSPS